MYNQTGVIITKYANRNQILFATDHQVSVSVVVSQSAGSELVGTRNVIKAGTPLTGNLDARTTPFTAANSNGSDVVGILLHDVDVTAGDANGTLLLHGFVNTAMVEATPKGKLVSAVKKALPMICFIEA